MTPDFSLFTELSDAALLERVSELTSRERQATAAVVAALAEVERRKLYLSLGHASLFVYCTRALRLSEHAAYNRIEAARAASRFPSIIHRLHDGSLTLSTVRLLAPALTPENHARMISAATQKSKREVELLVVAERPRPDAPTLVRRLPASAPRPPIPDASTTPPAPAAPPSLPPPLRCAAAPLAPDRYKIQFTASSAFHGKFRRAQALLRHAVPNADAAIIFERALDLLLASIERDKLAVTDRPRHGRSRGVHSRHIPAAVKREVWKRDSGRCAFAGAHGRCEEEGFLEYHHVVPFAHGGAATTANIELRCRAHNAYEADRAFKPMLTE